MRVEGFLSFLVLKCKTRSFSKRPGWVWGDGPPQHPGPGLRNSVMCYVLLFLCSMFFWFVRCRWMWNVRYAIDKIIQVQAKSPCKCKCAWHTNQNNELAPSTELPILQVAYAYSTSTSAIVHLKHQNHPNWASRMLFIQQDVCFLKKSICQ